MTDVEELAKAIQRAVVDEPWYDTDEQRPVEDFSDAYARRIAERVIELLDDSA